MTIPCRSAALFAAGALALPLGFAAPAGNPLLPLLTTSCAPQELGKVTQVRVLDSQQMNAAFKKMKAPQIAKPGEVWVQVYAQAKAAKDSNFEKLERAPTEAEIREVTGKPQCVMTGGI